MPCKICGGFSGFYPLCSKCFDDKDAGLIEKCEECGTWHRINEKCNCTPQECVICGKTQTKTICTECAKIINDEKKQLDNNFSFPELTDMYYQIKSSSKGIDDDNSFQISLCKLKALSDITISNHKIYTLQNNLQKDIDFLKNQRKEFKEKNLESSTTNETNKLDTVESDYRRINPAKYRCNDGHYVRSKSEREIDNFLYDQKIWHEYEKEEYDPSTKETYYIDFFLPEHEIYIEHFGLDSQEYLKKCERKIDFFDRNKMLYFTTNEKEANILNDILKRKIKDIEFNNHLSILKKR